MEAPSFFFEGGLRYCPQLHSSMCQRTRVATAAIAPDIFRAIRHAVYLEAAGAVGNIGPAISGEQIAVWLFEALAPLDEMLPI